MKKMRLVVALTLAVTALAWTPPERVDRKPEDYRTYRPALTVGRDGTIHVVWPESPGSGFLEKIMYSRRQGDTWTIPVNISRDSGDIRVAAIVLDSSGRALVVWSEESYARMRYVRQLGDTWSEPKLCFPNNGITPRLAVDSRGRIHLLFEELGGQDAIWYSHYCPDGDSWATPSLVADDVGSLGFSDLAVDSRDWLHAVWSNRGTWGVNYSYNDGSGWSAPVPLPDPAPGPDDYSCYPRIAVDTADRPHVVWEERSGGYHVYYSRFDGDSWTAPHLIDEQSGLRPVVCCDDRGNTHVIWRNTGLWHVVRSDSGWSEKAVATDSAGAMLPALAHEGQVLHLTWWGPDWGVYYCRHDLPGGVVEVQLRPLPSASIVASPAGRRLRLEVRESGAATISLWDSAGRRTMAQDLGRLQPGAHEVRLPVEQVPAGRYVCRLVVGDHEAASGVVIVR